MELHTLGFAHSVEVYDDNGRLCGGLYGVNRGKLFCGESMFSLEADSSKLALAALARFLLSHGATFLDSQVANDHMASLGGLEIPRDEYLEKIQSLVVQTDISGWLSYRASGRDIMDGSPST
jgi:leucyl/phenylalanyl-tRNA--protein transferase